MSRFVIYYNDAHFPLRSIAQLPYTHVILSFIVPDTSDASGKTVTTSGNLEQVWDDVSALRQAGKKVMISFGGGAFSTASYKKLSGTEPAIAEQIAAIVERHGLDGVDIDYEDTPAFRSPTPADAYDGVAFVCALTEALHAALPEDKRLISHAPQPPYLSPWFEDGPYLKILKQVGQHIDWINLQYYNNRGFDDADQITGLSGTPFVSSICGLNEGVGGVKWPASQVTVGKPVAPEDAGSGYVPVDELVSEVIEPLVDKFGSAFGGVMGWQYYDDAAGGGRWHQTIAKALPLL